MSLSINPNFNAYASKSNAMNFGHKKEECKQHSMSDEIKDNQPELSDKAKRTEKYTALLSYAMIGAMVSLSLSKIATEQYSDYKSKQETEKIIKFIEGATVDKESTTKLFEDFQKEYEKGNKPIEIDKNPESEREIINCIIKELEKGSK